MKNIAESQKNQFYNAKEYDCGTTVL